MTASYHVSGVKCVCPHRGQRGRSRANAACTVRRSSSVPVSVKPAKGSPFICHYQAALRPWLVDSACSARSACPRLVLKESSWRSRVVGQGGYQWMSTRHVMFIEGLVDKHSELACVSVDSPQMTVGLFPTCTVIIPIVAASNLRASFDGPQPRRGSPVQDLPLTGTRVASTRAAPVRNRAGPQRSGLGRSS